MPFPFYLNRQRTLGTLFRKEIIMKSDLMKCTSNGEVILNILYTDRLILRPFKDTDAEAMFETGHMMRESLNFVYGIPIRVLKKQKNI